jgi:hypothetical protein
VEKVLNLTWPSDLACTKKKESDMAAFLRIRGTTVLTRMWKVFISKLMAVVTFALFVLPSGLLASAAALAETPQSDEELSRKILGTWDWKKHVTYFADGTWMLQNLQGVRQPRESSRGRSTMENSF